jgi:hypothetical protein
MGGGRGEEEGRKRGCVIKREMSSDVIAEREEKNTEREGVEGGGVEHDHTTLRLTNH